MAADLVFFLRNDGGIHQICITDTHNAKCFDVGNILGRHAHRQVSVLQVWPSALNAFKAIWRWPGFWFVGVPSLPQVCVTAVLVVEDGFRSGCLQGPQETYL
jgi:hypothetical protein